MQWNDQVVAAPQWANTQVLWFRKSLAEAAGLDMSQPVTWDQVIDAAERVTGRTLNVSFAPRREGDPATLYADAALITRELGWSPQFGNLDDMIAHAWAWFQAHPNGYG